MTSRYTFDFTAILRYWPELLQGIWLAASLSVLTFLLGTILGIGPSGLSVGSPNILG